ncbi:MAG: helix-turn-helix transcriptional regulator [Chloroflexi bacterium]|nr:helix-turn-helix transcriptional regulator [Chloroflexota bacterium]
MKEESAKLDLWLQLVEARRAAGLTQAELAERLGVSQAQVARVEKKGYDGQTRKTLPRYAQALGEGFSLEVAIRRPGAASRPSVLHRAGPLGLGPDWARRFISTMRHR